MARAGERLEDSQLSLLRKEWEAAVQKMPWYASVLRVCAYAGMVAAFYLLCGGYIYFVDDRRFVDGLGFIDTDVWTGDWNYYRCLLRIHLANGILSTGCRLPDCGDCLQP